MPRHQPPALQSHLSFSVTHHFAAEAFVHVQPSVPISSLALLAAPRCNCLIQLRLTRVLHLCLPSSAPSTGPRNLRPPLADRFVSQFHIPQTSPTRSGLPSSRRSATGCPSRRVRRKSCELTARRWPDSSLHPPPHVGSASSPVLSSSGPSCSHLQGNGSAGSVARALPCRGCSDQDSQDGPSPTEVSPSDTFGSP